MTSLDLLVTWAKRLEAVHTRGVALMHPADDVWLAVAREALRLAEHEQKTRDERSTRESGP